eukprot:scaffold1383_cov68-Cylindrotheca_fusiformis.AAC.4
MTIARTTSLSPLANFLQNSLRVLDYDSIQVIQDNALLPQATGHDSIVQHHLSPSARKRRQSHRRTMQRDRWGDLVTSTDSTSSPPPGPKGRGVSFSRNLCETCYRRTDRWGDLIGNDDDDDERALPPYPTGGGSSTAMLQRQESLDRYFNQVYTAAASTSTTIEEDEPLQPSESLVTLPEEQPYEGSDDGEEDASNYDTTRINTNKAKNNEAVKLKPIKEKSSAARAA